MNVTRQRIRLGILNGGHSDLFHRGIQKTR